MPLIGAGRNPDELATVFADHSRVPLWVEETLRYDTSSQILARTVAEDIEFYGTTLHDGDVLLLVPGRRAPRRTGVRRTPTSSASGATSVPSC